MSPLSRHHRTCFPRLHSSLFCKIGAAVVGSRRRHSYISYDYLLLDVRNYNGVLDITANNSANHENVSGVSADPQMQG